MQLESKPGERDNNYCPPYLEKIAGFPGLERPVSAFSEFGLSVLGGFRKPFGMNLESEGFERGKTGGEVSVAVGLENGFSVIAVFFTGRFWSCGARLIGNFGSSPYKRYSRGYLGKKENVEFRCNLFISEWKHNL